MKYLIYSPQRKPNLNTWTCPICHQEMNSRGAPGHLRNKHGKKWRHVYLTRPRLIIEDEKKANLNTPSQLERYLFCGLDYRNNDNAKRIISNLTRIATEIRKAVVRNDNFTLNNIGSLLRQLAQDIMLIKDSRDDT
ncbi:MAG: hypothetical protein QQN41_07830 [Nitrosopumilus sp.]